jgi:hypothetical protein
MLLPKQILAMKKIVSKVKGLALSTVRIERNERGPRALATDGRRAVIFQWDEPEPDKYPPVEGLNPRRVRQFAANVPPNALADAARGIPSRTSNPILRHLLLDESDASMVRVAATANESVTRGQATAVEGQYPDCDSALPAPAREGNLYDPARHGAVMFTHTRIGVNAKQFAETMRVVSDLATDDLHNTVVMTVPVDPRRPIRLDARCPGRRAIAAIMPVNAEFDRYDEPAEPRRSLAVPVLATVRAARALPAPASSSAAAPLSQPASSKPRVRKPRRSRKPPIEFAEGGGSAVAPTSADPR